MTKKYKTQNNGGCPLRRLQGWGPEVLGGGPELNSHDGRNLRIPSTPEKSHDASTFYSVTPLEFHARKHYLSELVIARKTRSSIATERVKSVAACPASPTLFPFAPIAGPASFDAVGVPSPGCIEMREVLGVQPDTPVQVSRTKTCRYPLFLAPGVTPPCCGA